MVPTMLLIFLSAAIRDGTGIRQHPDKARNRIPKTSFSVERALGKPMSTSPWSTALGTPAAADLRSTPQPEQCRGPLGTALRAIQRLWAGYPHPSQKLPSAASRIGCPQRTQMLSAIGRMQ